MSDRARDQARAGEERAHARILALRAAGRSIDEIALAIAREGAPLNRTGIAEVIAEEGFGRLWRRPKRCAARPDANSYHAPA